MYIPKEHRGKPYTLHELIESLQAIEQDYGSGDMEVRMMLQRGWPFEHTIKGLAVSDDFGEDENYEAPICVYLVEGTQIDYGNGGAWDAAER